MEAAVQIIVDGRNVAEAADVYRMIRESHAGWQIADDVDALWVLFTETIDRPVDLTWIHADRCRAVLGVQFLMMMVVLQEADGHTSRRPERPRFRLTMGGPAQ